VSLVPIAALAAAFPVHPFDLLYNYVCATSPAPALPNTRCSESLRLRGGRRVDHSDGWAFQSGAIVTGMSRGMLRLWGLLVSTTDICIPSLIYQDHVWLSTEIRERQGLTRRSTARGKLRQSTRRSRK